MCGYSSSWCKGHQRPFSHLPSQARLSLQWLEDDRAHVGYVGYLISESADFLHHDICHRNAQWAKSVSQESGGEVKIFWKVLLYHMVIVQQCFFLVI